MEPNFLLSSSIGSPSTSLPFVRSCKSNSLENSKPCVNSHVSLSTFQLEKSQFWGQSIVFQGKNGSFCGTVRKTHVPFEPVRAFVKRRKELPFDDVIERDKKPKIVSKIVKILMNQRNRTMSVTKLGRFRKELGVDKMRRLVDVLRKFPAVFEVGKDKFCSFQFKLTPEAERLYFEELKVRNQMEDLLVVKLRKLLMMSLEKQITLWKLAHLRNDLGLPLEFYDTICYRYPQYFRVVATRQGKALELTHWDPKLAVSAAELSEEENRARELEEKNLIIDRPLKFNRVKLPKGLKLSKHAMAKLCKFRSTPYISPYSDFSHLRLGTLEKERHSCGVIHEILSLTVEKRTLVDTFNHFQEEFGFCQRMRGLLIRHPEMFYVSAKGRRDSVFLREAYRGSHLIEKEQLFLVKEKLRFLVIPRFPRQGAPNKYAGGPDRTADKRGEEDEHWSGMDGYVIGDGMDDHNDGWSDEDDDMPPNFDEDDGTKEIHFSKSINQRDKSMKNGKKQLVPVFLDGQPRKRW